MEDYLNEVIVVDVEPMFVYVGTLTAVSEKSAKLTDADVHDLRDSETTRERYLLDSRIHGVRSNRKEVIIRMEQIVSVSRLADVLE